MKNLIIMCAFLFSATCSWGQLVDLLTAGGESPKKLIINLEFQDTVISLSGEYKLLLYEGKKFVRLTLLGEGNLTISNSEAGVILLTSYASVSRDAYEFPKKISISFSGDASCSGTLNFIDPERDGVYTYLPTKCLLWGDPAAIIKHLGL